MKRLVLAALLLALRCAQAVPTAEESAVHEVFRWLDGQDCTRAVKALNEGLAGRYPDVQLLAGSMYEQGVCVKRSWEKAVDFYIAAYQQGKRAAAYKLQAGYAASVGGPDPAAALWWAKEVGWWPKGCGVSDAARGDPDKFVAELAAWLAGHLQQCSYVTGVLATVAGDIEYPARALQHGLSGKVKMVFTPAVPAFDFTNGEQDTVHVVGFFGDGNILRDRRSRSVTDNFRDTLSDIGQRALARYPQPQGIDPKWTEQTEFRFETLYR